MQLDFTNLKIEGLIVRQVLVVLVDGIHASGELELVAAILFELNLPGVRLLRGVDREDLK